MIRKSKKQTFVFKASWPSTCKLIKVVASDEDVALIKAYKRRDVKGCLEIKLVRSRS